MSLILQTAPYNNILATPDYDEWRYMRRMTNPAFSPENIRKVALDRHTGLLPLQLPCCWSDPNAAYCVKPWHQVRVQNVSCDDQGHPLKTLCCNAAAPLSLSCISVKCRLDAVWYLERNQCRPPGALEAPADLQTLHHQTCPDPCTSLADHSQRLSLLRAAGT